MVTKRKSTSNWIQKAKIKKGAFTAKAKKAGVSVKTLAKRDSKAGAKISAKTKRQAVLARTFEKMSKKRKKK